MQITVHSPVVRIVERQEKMVFRNITRAEVGLTITTESEYLIEQLRKAEEEFMRPSKRVS